MPKADMRVKALLAEDLVTFLSDDTNSIVCMDMGLLVDNLMPWLTGSHFKIAQKSLEAFSELIKRLGPDFNAYTATVLPHVIDRLGDSKDTVREKAQLLLQNMMEHRVLTPQATLDKLSAACLKHKNAKVREEFLQTIVNTLNEYGTAQLSVRTYIQLIAGHLLGDPSALVRDTAIQTLVEIYKHVGDRLRVDLRRMDDIPAAKLTLLEQKFDQVKSEGLLLKSASQSVAPANNGHDESDNVSVTSSVLSARERPTKIVKRTVSATSRNKLNSGSQNFAISGGNSCNDMVSDTTGAGAVNMEIFEASFELVPQLNLFTAKDMDDVYKHIMQTLNDKTCDWEKRIESLKKLRSLLMLNMQAQPQFGVQLKELAISFLDILKEELRSQVIREACITIAYMSKTLRNKCDTFCAFILDQLINLIQNSAKVIATSSMVALKYIVKYTHSPKLIKLTTDNLQQSKSKDIRASLCELMCMLLDEWPTKAIERYAPIVRDTLKKSISDADNEARRHSRRAYWLYRRHFPELADQIYGTLDIATQRALERERDGGSTAMPTSVVANTRFLRSPGSVQKPAAGARSVSAVDAAAAQRAKARHQYALFSRKKLSSNNAATPNHSSTSGTLPRARYGGGGGSSITPVETVHVMAPHTVATARTRGRSGVSQSQPGSRSTSPSSKLREQYGYYKPITGTIPKKASGIPRSLANSRETSPTRVAMKRSIYSSGASMGGSARRTPERSNHGTITTSGRPLAAQRMLQQSREAESALADALSPDGNERPMLMGNEYGIGDYGRGMSAGVGRLGRKFLSRDESDDSEASSVCSERSFESSFTRGNNSSYSLSGSRNRLDWSCTRAPFDDIETIIQYCASTHWAERKDGLNSLTHYLADGKELTPAQLQNVLDMFRKMFMDSHTKVYSLFLDTVTELILIHAQDLHDWLFILLTRLFNKLGTELLNSMNGKIWKTLQVVHEYFPTDLQMRDIFRILSDSAQTPCIKSKIAILKFLTNLASTYCKPSDFPADDSPLAVDRAVLKIVQLSGDQKSVELRGQARFCLIALYNCNAPQMTKILASLPKGYQDTAKVIIQSHLRRSSTSGTNSPSSSPVSSSSPKPLQSPSLGPFASLQPQFNTTTSPRSRQSSVDHELYSKVDVQHNIHKTSEEITNCFGAMQLTTPTTLQTTNSSVLNEPATATAAATAITMMTPTPTTRQYHSLSAQANMSGLSLLNSSSASNGYNGYLNEQLDSCASNSNSKTQSATTTESNTPESTTMRLEGQLYENNHKLLQHHHQIHFLQQQQQQQLGSASNSATATTTTTGNASPAPSPAALAHLSNKQLMNYNIADNGELILENGQHEHDIIKSACALNADVPLEQLQQTLNNLSVCIKGGSCELPNKHFRAIMKMLVDLLDSKRSEVMIMALYVLGKIVRSERMKHNWINFLELILLRIIDCYQVSKETAREIDTIIPRIAPALPLHAAIDIVNPVIATSAYPQNLCAVKLLSELAERHGSELTEQQLDSVFPNLARLTDDMQSMVRKAAVFCIVKLYFVMGEDKVKPKFSMLNPSKVRLLNVYIDKQRNSSGGGSSTKNSSAASSS